MLACGTLFASALRAYRRDFAAAPRLIPAPVQHPGAVAQLIEDIEAHHEADKRWQANQKLGKMVEDLIQKQLKSYLSLLRIRAKHAPACGRGARLSPCLCPSA